MKPKFMIFLLLVAMVACKSRNKLNTNQQMLAAEIITAEQEKQTSMEELFDSQTPGDNSSVLRISESRLADENSPPIILDILASRNNPQKIRLSELFSKIEYVPLQSLPDSTFYEIGGSFLVSEKFIYGYSIKGIAQYSLNGQFLKYICKNETGYGKYNGNVMLTKEQADRFIGSSTPKLFLGKLYYLYEDRPAKLALYMEYEESGDMHILNPAGQIENRGEILGLGKPVMKIPGNEDSFRTPEINPLGNNLVGFTNNRKIYSAGKDFFAVASTSGDTVCSFKDFDPIKTYTKSVGRGAEDGYSYVLNGILHIRQIYNDTIYQVLPPNHLVPKYVLNFGEFGIKSSLEGVDPGYDLSGKLIPGDFLETGKYLFLTYTRDYSCPNTAKSGSLKYSRLIYDKQKKKIIPVYVDEAAFMPKGRMIWPGPPDINIENDLDDSPFLWPHETTSFGSPYSWINGKQLHEKFNTKSFGNLSLNENDFVIAIYK